ncbi:MAG: hypothetical protein EBS05_07605 [Proteobacteria bacterium]|nr:hypothetical protein [Pseudomonadota bacterium]
MRRPLVCLSVACALWSLAAPAVYGAPSAKEKFAPVTPYYDPPDQPFRMAPMPQSTRSIVVPLATNLHLAFDTALLRTHTVWSGKGLALLGPQFGLPKAPFISTNDGTVLWTMPPVFPWAVGKLPEKDETKLPAGARFLGVAQSKDSTAILYEIRAGDETVRIRESSIAMKQGGFLRLYEISPCRQSLFFLAHAEDGATLKDGPRLDSKVPVQLLNGPNATSIALQPANVATLISHSVKALYDAAIVTETGSEKGVASRMVESPQGRVWVKVPPHSEPVRFELLTDFSGRPTVTAVGGLRSQLNVAIARTSGAGAVPRPSSASTPSFRAESFPLPPEANLLVCGMDFVPNGDLVVCTWPGEVWIIEKATGSAKDVRYRRFARGLCEPMGVAVRDGKIYVGTKQGLYRLSSKDSDAEADLYECLSQGWSYTGHYNAFSYGPVFDKAGNFMLANAGHSGRWDSAYMGWALRISPDGKKLDTICSGLREPNGIGTFGPDCDVFVTENQGQWMAACKLNHVTPGKFYGHPSAWPAKEEEYGKHTRFDPPAVWFPYKLARSTTGFAEITDDRFGPFKGQLMVGDFQNAIVTRVQLEKVNGEYQGAVWPFLKQFQSGVNRLVYGPDGKLYVGGLQAPVSWKAVAPLNASLERIEYTGKLPFEVKEVHAQPDGFELTFTQPVEAKAAADPESYDVTQYGFKYHAKYGSPELDHDGKENAATVIKVVGATVSPDKLKVRLKLAGWKTGYVTMVRSLDVKDGAGESLVNDTFWYTLNQLPK